MVRIGVGLEIRFSVMKMMADAFGVRKILVMCRKLRKMADALAFIANWFRPNRNPN